MKVLVTGSSGFLGSHVLEVFEQEGHEILPLPSSICDLRNLKETRMMLITINPDLVVHTAAMCGGMGFNAPRQGQMFYENSQIALSFFEAARLAKVPKIISVSSSCAYPDIKKDFTEWDLWSGETHPSVMGYGMAKRFQNHMARLYKLQYGMDIVSVIFPNLYGPRDHFEAERSHVVPALIRRFANAKTQNLSEVEIWGSGMAERELLYVKDAATSLLILNQKGCDCELPLNIGTGRGELIRDVAFEIKNAVKYGGKLVFNLDQPEGQLRKVMDVGRMKNLLEWTPPTPLREGIQKTVDWYLSTNERR